MSVKLYRITPHSKSMASLHKLLSEEGFDTQKKSRKKVKFKDKINQQNSITLPIFICRDSRSFDSTRPKSEKALSVRSSSVHSSRKGGGSGSENSKTEEPAIDDVAIKAMVSILTGYIGQYLKDKNFRQKIREKFRPCFNHHSDNGILSHIELCIQSIERLVENGETEKEMDFESLQNSIKLLKIVASLDSNNSIHEKPNSNLSAFAQLYLSIVYKIAKNDRISARHLLQVFNDSPFLARTHLLPELWEHFFLPHLLHLKIWYNKELEFISTSDYVGKEKKIRALSEQYNSQMDNGTAQFALYYKEWLKVGGEAPSVPSVHLPSKQSYSRSRRMSSNSSTSHRSITNKSLYQAVFGPVSKSRSMDLDNRYGALGNIWDLQEQENNCIVEEEIKHCSHVEKKALARKKSSSQHLRVHELWPESQKPDYFRFLACRTKPAEFMIQGTYVSNSENIKNDNTTLVFPLNDMTRAIATICSSECLSDSETAIRVVSENWLNPYKDLKIVTSLSQASVIQGIMEVLFVSENDEVLELGISILAELATKNEINTRHILNSDPHLEVSIRLLRSSNLFLKAAVLLYLVKPRAKQMILVDWIPLVLRVLEFGDQSQTLFTVRCSPYEAAYYFLDQLLTGFGVDKNYENAREIVSLGGLRLLVRRMDVGDICEKSKAASILLHCIKADGSCRYYLAKNLKKETIISLLVLGKLTKDPEKALALLTELLCLSRISQRIEILTELKKGWECLNSIHILLSYLQKARVEERPIIAVILLLMDLMGDPLECSIYREEAVDTIVNALDSSFLDEKVQDQTARALLLLGGHFSYTGEPDIEEWLLRKAGFQDNLQHSIRATHGYLNLNEEEKTRENWQKRAAVVLLSSGNRRLLTSLSDSIANSIPRLARASLVTVCWMSNVIVDKQLQFGACSILVPQLIECLNYNNDDRDIEERILASFSILGLTKGTDYFSKLLSSGSGNEASGRLEKLSRVTWTAKELISLITSTT
ncbi:hypothetical protein ACJIZ3_013456 [Penstemon smallii]|uniref:E3 ubiquitin-protein ligase LIN n=1 Tax=Penstemon smallii TaxID=265156 RepID=A0ABD3UPW2_9LAMI